MLLTNKKIRTALTDGKSIRCKNMPEDVFLKCENGTALYVEKGGEPLGYFQPFVTALEDNTWFVVD